MADEKDQDKVGRGYGSGYNIVTAGFQFVFSILFFMWLGSLADRKLSTEPLFLLIGMALGFATGGYAAWAKVKAVSKGPG